MQLLPTTITHLTFGYYFDQPLDDLPNSITHLTLGDCFNEKLDHLPDSVKYPIFTLVLILLLDCLHFFIIKLITIIDSTTYLNLGASFNQEVDHLPKSLVHLVFGRIFNRRVYFSPLLFPFFIYSNISFIFVASVVNFVIFGQVDHLPGSLEHLALAGRDFNRPVDHLPSPLTHLELGFNFNQPVNHLPSSLKHLVFGSQFNFPVDLLPNLETLSLGNSFNMSIDLLPRTLMKLIIGGCAFNQPIPSLPRLTHLSIQSSTFNQPLDQLPSTTINLEFSSRIRPPTLTSLTQLSCDGSLITNIPDSLKSLCCGVLPRAAMDVISNSSISSLQLELKHSQPLPPLPQSLRTLSLVKVEGTVLEALPVSLTHLEFDECNFDLDGCNADSANNFPASLTHLIFFSCARPFARLPPNLTHLSFGCYFNQSIIGKLPQTLQSLELGYSFTQPLRSLPPSLKFLSGSLISSYYI